MSINVSTPVVSGLRLTFQVGQTHVEISDFSQKPRHCPRTALTASLFLWFKSAEDPVHPEVVIYSRGGPKAASKLGRRSVKSWLIISPPPAPLRSACARQSLDKVGRGRFLRARKMGLRECGRPLHLGAVKRYCAAYKQPLSSGWWNKTLLESIWRCYRLS